MLVNYIIFAFLQEFPQGLNQLGGKISSNQAKGTVPDLDKPELFEDYYKYKRESK
jgi:hypothetical protein